MPRPSRLALSTLPQASIEVPSARPLYFFAGRIGRNLPHGVRDAVARRGLLSRIEARLGTTSDRRCALGLKKLSASR